LKDFGEVKPAVATMTETDRPTGENYKLGLPTVGRNFVLRLPAAGRNFPGSEHFNPYHSIPDFGLFS